MMRLTIKTAVAILLSLPLFAQDTVQVQTSAICEMCKETLEYEMTFTKGIKFVGLNLENKVLTVGYKENKITEDGVRQAISKIGYHADWVARDNEAYEKLPFCCKDGAHGTPTPQVPTKKPSDS